MVAAPLRLCFFQHLLDLSFGAAVGHAGPVGGVAEDRADLFVGELAEDPEGEHLLVRFFQPVEALVDGKSGVFVDEQFIQVRLRGSGGRERLVQRDGLFRLAAVGVITVPRYGKEPGADVLSAIKVLQTVQGLEKRLLRQFFGQRFRVGEPLQKQEHIPEIEPVKCIHVHGLGPRIEAQLLLGAVDDGAIEAVG